MGILDWLKVILIGIVEGFTEWLPISSTGHMMLVQEFLPFTDEQVFTDAFVEMFNVVIQLGAILAVVTIYFNKLNPFGRRLSPKKRQSIWNMWGLVCVACIPAGVIGILFDDILDKYLYNVYVIAAMLILYGIAFIVMEFYNQDRENFRIQKMNALDYKTAALIGVFQVLALIPGTSRSGATILGAMLLGCSRSVAAQFTFYLAIPVMFGASLLKLVKFVLETGASISGMQIVVLLLGMVVAYGVSMFAIGFLMRYIKKHDFKAFGIYRIVLGIIVLAACLLRA